MIFESHMVDVGVGVTDDFVFRAFFFCVFVFDILLTSRWKMIAKHTTPLCQQLRFFLTS